MSDNMEKKTNTEAAGEQHYSLNDDRRVKVLSPGAMVAKRFFRNRIAVVGLCILAFMFVFSFIGGIVTPYKEDQQFYRIDVQNKEYAGVVLNKDFRFAAADGQSFPSTVQAQMVIAVQKGETNFSYHDVNYSMVKEGEDFYRILTADGTTLAIAYKDVVNPSVEGTTLSFDF